MTSFWVVSAALQSHSEDISPWLTDTQSYGVQNLPHLKNLHEYIVFINIVSAEIVSVMMLNCVL